MSVERLFEDWDTERQKKNKTKKKQTERQTDRQTLRECVGAYSSHNYAPVYNFTSFELSHICKAHERLAVISHPYRPRSFTCYWNKTETERTNGYRNKNQHGESWRRRRKLSRRRSCWESNPRPFDHEPALYRWAIPACVSVIMHLVSIKLVMLGLGAFRALLDV